jgi:hypothetical protein
MSAIIGAMECRDVILTIWANAAIAAVSLRFGTDNKPELGQLNSLILMEQ